MCVRAQGYAVKVQGKDHKTDGITALVPHWEHWLNVAGVCRDGMTFSGAFVQAKMKGGEYTPVPIVQKSETLEQPASSTKVDPDSPLRNPAEQNKPLFGDEKAASDSDEELIE